MPSFLFAIVTAIHIIACVALTVSILLQSGKGGGLAGAFGGGGSSQTLFGGRGAATFLSRASTVLAVIFFLTSLTLGVAQTRGALSGSSLIQEEARRRAGERTGTTAPGAPATQPPATGAPATDGSAAPGGAQTDPVAPATPATPGTGGGR
ncbi:MAG TPA: preprotein translocase subunit SecG [Acidobacteriota bacterium]|nr:preprotein translocase subunit SecG [Acidobacteriota bacterium]